MNFYKDNTFEDIMNRMLERIPDSLDKREGSVIYDALAPSALEISAIYSVLDYLFKQSYILTADKDYLELLAKPFIDLKRATKAILNAEFLNNDKQDIEVPIGSRFNFEKLNFVVTKKKSNGKYLIECEEEGIQGNITSATLTPIEYVEDLAIANIIGIFKEAYDDEDVEVLRNRLIKKLREPATSGNIYHYMQWAREVNGVGEVKVFPLWNGNGTVKVVILNANNLVADSELIEAVKNNIEKQKPIGASVTVATANTRDIEINVNVTKVAGADIEDIKNNFKKKVQEYFKSIALKFDYVSVAKIGNILLSTDEVLDYKNLYVNGSTYNLDLKPEEVPFLKNIDFSEK